MFKKNVEDGEKLDAPNVEEEIRKGEKKRKEVTEEVQFKEWGEESDRAVSLPCDWRFLTFTL